MLPHPGVRTGAKARVLLFNQSIYSYDFSIKWLTPFYPAIESQVAGGDEKCMDYVFNGDAADRLDGGLIKRY